MSAIVPNRQRGRRVIGLLTDLVNRLATEHAPDAVRVLDCGGGTGALAVPLAHAGSVVTVVDRSVDALALLSRRAADAGVGDRIVAVPGDLDALDLGLEAGVASFDLVVAHDVLTAVTDPDVTLATVAGHVAAGGWLSVQVVNEAASVLGRALAGDVIAARRALAAPTRGAYELQRLVGLVEALALTPHAVHGVGVLSEYVSGPDLEAHDADITDLAALDDELGTRSPYREIASRVHVLAHRDHGTADPTIAGERSRRGT